MIHYFDFLIQKYRLYNRIGIQNPIFKRKRKYDSVHNFYTFQNDLNKFQKSFFVRSRFFQKIMQNSKN